MNTYAGANKYLPQHKNKSWHIWYPCCLSVHLRKIDIAECRSRLVVKYVYMSLSRCSPAVTCGHLVSLPQIGANGTQKTCMRMTIYEKYEKAWILFVETHDQNICWTCLRVYSLLQFRPFSLVGKRSYRDIGVKISVTLRKSVLVSWGLGFHTWGFLWCDAS